MVFASSSSVVDAACGDLGFGVALGAGGGEGPVVEVGFEGGEAGVGPVGGRVKGEPAFGHAGGKNGAEQVVDGVEVAAGQRSDWSEDLGAGGGLHRDVSCEQGLHDVEARGEVEVDGLSGVPVGGGLQDGGAAEAAVGYEEFFAEGGRVGGEFVAGLRFVVGGRCGGGDGFGGEAAEVAPAGFVLGREDERDERGASGNDVEAEMAGDLVAEAGGAHFGDGEAAGGDDGGGGVEGAGGGVDAEGADGGSRG